MNFAFDMAIAFVLDLIIGDPECFPHPVRAIGALINLLEKLTRKVFRNERIAGTITGLITVLAAGGAVYGSLEVAKFANPLAGRILNILWLYMGLSARSLSDSALRIRKHLVKGDMKEARKSLSVIVGRDTENLDENGISRATIESVAENTVDGILSPIFFAAIGGTCFGAPLMWIFKAISTCDSMIGHKDERYIRFGTFSARLDDAANFIPARLCYILFPVAAFLTGKSPVSSFKIAIRDSGYHDSPNAGIPEAAAAGALRICLGGTTIYDGIPHEKKNFGGEFSPPDRRHIVSTLQIMWVSAILMLILSIGLRILL